MITAHIDDPRLPPRFWAKVSPEPNSGCWLWTGAMGRADYGRFSVDRRLRQAHRVAFAAIRCGIPDGLVLDHLCRQHCCVNPDHLEPVTNRENIARGVSFASVNTAKRACPLGHPFDHENTRLNRGGARVCRECTRQHSRNARARMTPQQRERKRVMGRDWHDRHRDSRNATRNAKRRKARI